jgi:hypothetical protein
MFYCELNIQGGKKMTSRKLKQSQTNGNGKAKQFLVNNLRPTLFAGTTFEYRVGKIKEDSRMGGLKAGLKKTAKNLPLWLIRTVSALGVYSGLNYLYGARSWDTKGDLSANRMIKDSGPVAKVVAAKAVVVSGISAVAPEKMAVMANIMMAVEFAMCAIRMVAEQIAWRKTKFSGEVAGTGATPLLAFLGEATFKAIEKKPADPLKRFAIATIGMWGNFVRIVHSGLIIAFGMRLWNKLKPKPPPCDGPKRNNYGYPILDKDNDHFPPAA